MSSLKDEIAYYNKCLNDDIESGNITEKLMTILGETMYIVVLSDNVTPVNSWQGHHLGLWYLVFLERRACDRDFRKNNSLFSERVSDFYGVQFKQDIELKKMYNYTFPKVADVLLTFKINNINHEDIETITFEPEYWPASQYVSAVRLGTPDIPSAGTSDVSSDWYQVNFCYTACGYGIRVNIKMRDGVALPDIVKMTTREIFLYHEFRRIACQFA